MSSSLQPSAITFGSENLRAWAIQSSFGSFGSMVIVPD
jgi:hypothetical protein